MIVEHLGLTLETADAYVTAIEEYAKLGAQLTLGGTGIIALRDVEDLHVLETAIAGKADFLVTANFKDFTLRDTQVKIPDRHAIYRSPAHSIHIVHPYLMVEWLRNGMIPKITC